MGTEDLGRQDIQKKDKRSVIKYVPVAGILIIIIVLIVKILMPMNKYNTGLKYYESGNYSEAIAVFEELGDYKDSEDMLNKSSEMDNLKKQYIEAVYDYEHGEYEAALKIFKNITYDDSNDYLEKCQAALYKQAEEYYKNKQYEDAYSIYTLITEYNNCEERVREIEEIQKKNETNKRISESVKKAKAYINNEKYKDALEELDNIEKTEVSPEITELYDKCYYGLALGEYYYGRLDNTREYIAKISEKTEDVITLSDKVEEFFTKYDAWIGKWQIGSSSEYYWIEASTGSDEKTVVVRKYADLYEEVELTDTTLLFHSSTVSVFDKYEITLTGKGSGKLTNYFILDDGSLKKTSERDIHRVSKEVG